MNTTVVPPVFHSGHYATYCLNNLLCMGSDLPLWLLMFFFLLYCGNTIDKLVSTLFFCNGKVMILHLYAGPSTVKIEAVFWKYSLKKMS